MRRSDREVKERAVLEEILKESDVCRIAVSTKGAPYIVPLNFGYEFDGEKLTLWFHCAREGRKLDLIAANNNVGFEMDCAHRLITGPNACDFSMNYRSVIGTGAISVIDDADEKTKGLSLIMEHYGGKGLPFKGPMLNAMKTLRLDVVEFTGKKSGD
ncbi:MAG: pyridoxamine 5'-phosphate oxidase family protein [Clostridiales Family XIII bacterium]|jgi:nitroimidazol reductase NimA-like FMN-containing flavoprotein (pyridoxamine 5'-phosphate oxidase superfamily)|nr:pyridoxamine 5'-phosphate oxidase family protein [Clostridiales Family XIII bacterium]